MRSYFRSWTVTTSRLAGILSLAACDQTHSLPLDVDSHPVQLDIVSGDNQTAPPGAELPNPLVVRVVDTGGSPVPSQIINFNVVEGDGSVYAGIALTNAQGLAYEWWTLGVSGAQVVEARAVDPGSGEKQVFATFTAVADTATTIAAVEISPPSASLTVGSSQQLAAVAKSATGEILPERTFHWKTSNPLIATVDANGLVTAIDAGTATITAESAGKIDSSEITVSSTRKPRRPPK